MNGDGEKGLRPEGSRGDITAMYTVWCGRCHEWQYLYEQKSRARTAEAKKCGWIKTSKYGWLCPDCASKTRSK